MIDIVFWISLSAGLLLGDFLGRVLDLEVKKFCWLVFLIGVMLFCNTYTASKNKEKEFNKQGMYLKESEDNE